RFLEHLDDDLLAGAEELVDRGLLAGRTVGDGVSVAAVAVAIPVAIAAVAVTVAVLAELDLLEVVQLLAHVGDVEERVALEPDVDERRLHAGQHPRDAPLVDVADRAARAGAL